MTSPVSVGGVVPASGASTRMGADDKLCLPLGGVPLLRRVVEALLKGGVSPVCVVLPEGRPARRRALEGLAGVIPVPNPDPARGMGHSIALGVRALPPDVDGVAIIPGDLPFTGAKWVAQLSVRFVATDRGILVPARGGRRGHPVFFRLDRYRAALEGLDGEEGGRSILAAHPHDVEEVPVDDPSVVRDVDTPAEWAKAERAWAKGGLP